MQYFNLVTVTRLNLKTSALVLIIHENGQNYFGKICQNKILFPFLIHFIVSLIGFEDSVVEYVIIFICMTANTYL